MRQPVKRFLWTLLSFSIHLILVSLFALRMAKPLQAGGSPLTTFKSSFILLYSLSVLFFITFGFQVVQLVRRAYFSEDIVGCAQVFQAKYRKGKVDGGWNAVDLHNELIDRFRASKAEGERLTRALLAYGFPSDVLRDISSSPKNQDLLDVLEEESRNSTAYGLLLVCASVFVVGLIGVFPNQALRILTFDFWKTYWPGAVLVALFSGRLPLESAFRYLKPGGKE